MARVWVVGIGEDGPAGMGPAAREAVAAATLLCGGRRHLAFFPDHPAPRLVVGANLAEVASRLEAELAAGGRPVVLASGDPLLYGIGSYLISALGRERVAVIPAVSSVALAFARAGVPWHDAAVVSAHGRPLAAAVAQALGAAKVAFLTDRQNTPAALARALLAAGFPDAPAWIGEHLGGPRERVRAMRLSQVAETEDVADLNVLVVVREEALAAGAPATGPAGAGQGHAAGAGHGCAGNAGRATVAPPSPPFAFGLPDSAYASLRGQITKAEVRAVALSKLRLGPGLVVWDVGAGSGSVAIEAAGLVPGGRVYAVERDPDQQAVLAENLRRFPGRPVVPVAGEAPAALAALPDPDAVFVGGSGGHLPGILAAAAARLRPGGRLVLTATTLETLAAAEAWAAAAGWPREWVQVSVARSTPLGGRTHLAPLHPVWILTVERPGEGGP